MEFLPMRARVAASRRSRRRPPGRDDREEHHRAEAASRRQRHPVVLSQHWDLPIDYVGHAEQWDESTSREASSSRLPHRLARGAHARGRVDLPWLGLAGGRASNGAFARSSATGADPDSGM